MQSYNPRHLPDDLATWMAARYQPTTSALEGGWEYWIQIDFLAWMNARSEFDIRREVPVGGSRADLFLNFGAGIGMPPPPAYPPCWIEIKAQGAKYPNQTFKDNVQADIDKMHDAGVACHQFMLVALSDDALIRDPTFARGTSDYKFVYQDDSTGVVLLLRQTA